MYFIVIFKQTGGSPIALLSFDSLLWAVWNYDSCLVKKSRLNPSNITIEKILLEKQNYLSKLDPSIIEKNEITTEE